MTAPDEPQEHETNQQSPPKDGGNAGPPDSFQDSDQNHQKIVTYMVGFLLAMFAFGWGSIYLYNLVCKQIDPGGTASKTELQEYKNVEVDKSRKVKVRFTANVNGDLPWEFYPKTKTVTVHPGERKLVNFISKNNAGRAIKGKAIYDIQPPQAGGYFKKVECFCFTQQTLEAGQRRVMPLNFWLDPDLPDAVDSVTLAYTFFNAESSRERARQHTDKSSVSSDQPQTANR